MYPARRRKNMPYGRFRLKRHVPNRRPQLHPQNPPRASNAEMVAFGVFVLCVVAGSAGLGWAACRLFF